MFEINNGILIKCDCETEIIRLPDGIIEIADKVFANCKAKKIICNEELLKICSYAFYGSEIEEIVFSTTLKYIDEYAFANCFNLSSVDFNNGLEVISDYAFMSTKLRSINIPSSINKIGINPFMGCSYLKEIKVDGNNPYYSSYKDTNTICEKASNKVISGCKQSVINESIEEIGEDSFNGVGIKELIIPNEVKILDKHSLASNFIKEIYTNNVSDIYDGAFMDNEKLEKIIFSNSLKTINSAIVSRCDKLAELILPNGVELIYKEAFANFLGTKVVIPGSVKVVEEKVFSHCYRLKAIDFLGNKEQWIRSIGNRNVFYNTTNPTSYCVNCLDGELIVPVFD